MKEPAPPRRATQRSLRRDPNKQGRAFEEGGAVRVFNEDGFLVEVLHPPGDAGRISRLLAAPNAVPVRKHGGVLVGIRLQSGGDDRGHAGERHGHSTVTTERVLNEEGQYIGTDKNLKHKNPSEAWRSLAAKVRPETADERKERE